MPLTQSGRRRNCDAGVAIAVPASKNKYFRALQLRRRRRNCSARKYLNFRKFENFAQNHFIFLKKLKRPKNLSYQKEQNLVFADFFLNLFNF